MTLHIGAHHGKQPPNPLHMGARAAALTPTALTPFLRRRNPLATVWVVLRAPSVIPPYIRHGVLDYPICGSGTQAWHPSPGACFSAQSLGASR